MVAESETTLFVAIVGTKQLRDLITDINILQNTLPTGIPHSPQTTSHSVLSSQSAAAHAGFMSRSIHLASSIESLYLQAHSKGLRFVICGHSLGGAVATLCLLRLLENLSEGIQNNFSSSNNATDSYTHHRQQQWPVQAICFGTPAIGNHHLAEYIRNRGWDVYFQYYNTPEDPVPRLFLSRTTTAATSPSHRKDTIPPPVPNGDDVSTEVEDTRALEELASSAELNGIESQVEEQDTTATTAAVVIAEHSTTTTTTTTTIRYGLFEKAKNAVKMMPSSRGTRKRQEASGLLVLPTIPLPSFTHFGEVHYLTSTRGIVHHHDHNNGIVPLTAIRSSSGGLPSTRQGWFAAHRMKLYRERLALCFFSAEDTGTDHNELGHIIIDTSLVPLPVIDNAETVLPVLQTDERSLTDKKRHKVQVAIKGREGLQFITQITLCFPSTTTISTAIPNDEDLRIKAIHVDNTQVKEQLLVKLASAGKESNRQRTRTRTRERGKDGHVSQHILATFLVPTSVLLGLQNTSKDTEMVVLEVYTDFAKTQVPVTLHAQTAWIVGNRELSGLLFDQLGQRADTKRQQATMAAEAGSSALPSAAAKLIAQAYKGRLPKKKKNSSLEIIQKTKEEEDISKTQGAKPAPTGFHHWSPAILWSSWLKKWEIKTTTSPPAHTMLFNGIDIIDMAPYFSRSSSIMAAIKAATKALQRYKKKEKEEVEEYIDPYEPLQDQRNEARFLLGSCEEGRSWGKDSFLLRKFTSITDGGGGGGGDSSLSRKSPPDLVLCVVDYKEVVDSSSVPKKAEGSLLNEIRHLNHAVLAVQATPLLVVVSPSAELVVNAAERRRLASMTHLVTVAGGVVPVVVDNCSMVEAALTMYARIRSENRSWL